MNMVNLSQINLLYLMSVKEMVNQDLQLAQIQTGLSNELLNALLDCSIYQLQELARFRPVSDLITRQRATADPLFRAQEWTNPTYWLLCCHYSIGMSSKYEFT